MISTVVLVARRQRREEVCCRKYLKPSIKSTSQPVGQALHTRFGSRAAALRWNAIAPDTRRSTNRAARQYHDFCQAHGRPTTLPAPLKWVDEGIASMAGKKSADSIRRDLGHIRTIHVEMGFDSAYLHSALLDRTIQGIKRTFGEMPSKQAFPIILPVLRDMMRTLDMHPSLVGTKEEAANVAAAFCLAYSTSLRMGECTYREFNRDRNIARANVNLAAGTIRLPSSKTDTSRKGTTIHLPSAADPLVDYTLRLRHLFRSYPNKPTSPLFTMANGKPFTSKIATSTVRAVLAEAGYQSADYTGHSFRRGGATWGKEMGMSDEEIKQQGRWKSEAYRRYIDYSSSHHISVANKVHAKSRERKRVHWEDSC